MRGKVESPEWRLAEIASRQHGVIALRQLIALGLGRGAIEHRLRQGRLHRVYRGAYAVGHRRLTLHGRYMAAVLACGEGALLSHRSAAAVWGLRTGGSRIEVTIPMSGRRGPDGIRLHRTRHVETGTLRDGIPLTGLGRTIVDLADVVTGARLDRAFEDADRLGILNVDDIHPIPGRRGESNIRALIAEQRVVPDTKSEFERHFAAVCREEGLRPPVFNVLVEGFLVDAFWPDARLVVELDGWAYHRTREAFEEDRARIAKLRRLGYEVLPLTWRRLERKRAEVIEEIRFFLSRPAVAQA